MSDLEKVDSKLATELLEVGQELEHDESVAPAISSEHAEGRAQRRRRLPERWEELVEEVRRLDGFQAFMRSTPFAQLRRAASDGPMVIINVSEYRTDALIVSTEMAVRCLHLEGLSITVINTLAYIWQQALQTVKDARGCQFLDHVLRHVCRTLWSGGLSLVAAVLEEYRVVAAPHKPFRVWWLPTGNLSLLPIHCAGPCFKGLNGIHDLCIPSYTTTLSALFRGRSGLTSDEMICRPFRILALNQPSVQGMPFLPFALAEVQELATSAFANHVTVCSGKDATAEQMDRNFTRYEWLHCCCHGQWDPHSPLDSAFRFPDGDLTLSAIDQKRLQRAEFAFLSACHTARQTTLLPDEFIHLAADMQTAGYRAVLATQWGMVDKDGPQLTAMFYNELAKLGSFRPDPRNTGEALHRALRRLRGHGLPLYRWALFVHIGI